MKYNEQKQIKKYKQDVYISIPSFINQIILLLNSGMVLQEAMVTIGVNYEKYFNGNLSVFQKEYLDVCLEAKQSGKSILYAFDTYCQSSHIKELMRLSQILIDGDNRGINLQHKLEEEGKKLWEERKRIALEKIRISDSKMSFPLALLLIALIIISAAPAMMQMYI